VPGITAVLVGLELFDIKRDLRSLLVLGTFYPKPDLPTVPGLVNL